MGAAAVMSGFDCALVIISEEEEEEEEEGGEGGRCGKEDWKSPPFPPPLCGQVVCEGRGDERKASSKISASLFCKKKILQIVGE